VPARTYANLDVVLERSDAGSGYQARIIASPAGEAGPVPVALTLSDDRLALLLMQMAPGIIRSRRVSSPDVAATQELGNELFSAVFHDGMREALYESVARSPHGFRSSLRCPGSSSTHRTG
jgi:hypothetical protein